MTILSPGTERLLTEFSNTPGVTGDQVANLRSSIANSPSLAIQLEDAVSAGHLEHFGLLPPGTNAGGTYDGASKTIHLPATILTAPIPSNDRRPAELTFVLGHEIQHGFNHAATQNAYAQFESDLQTVVAGDHDYTRAIGNMISSNRNDEAAANIAGWNALIGMVKASNPDATLADIYDANPRARDVVGRNIGPPVAFSVHPGFDLNDDLSITASVGNIEAMAKHYFDKPGHISQLGHNGNSDYRNYYGAYAVGRASEYEALNPAPGGSTRMTINMERLGLEERVLEQNGISLGAGSPAPQPYFNSSTQPPTLHHFDHTASSHTHIPISALEFTRSRSQPVGNMETEPHLQLGADWSLHGQIRSKVAELDAANGRTFDATSERLTASLLVVAKENGLDRVDHVVLSRQTSESAAAHTVFVVKGPLDDPASLRAATNTAEAAQRPLQESFDNLSIINQRQTDLESQEQTHQKLQEQMQEQQRTTLSR